MKLHVFPFSPNARKVLFVVHHLGLDVETPLVDLFKSEQMEPWFLGLNPNHMMPLLQDGDFVLWESNAIMQYLAAQKPGSGLWPSDAKAQADVSRWQCWQTRPLGVSVWNADLRKYGEAVLEPRGARSGGGCERRGEVPPVRRGAHPVCFRTRLARG